MDKYTPIRNVKKDSWIKAHYDCPVQEVVGFDIFTGKLYIVGSNCPRCGEIIITKERKEIK